jgi:hypothetical protein
MRQPHHLMPSYRLHNTAKSIGIYILIKYNRNYQENKQILPSGNLFSTVKFNTLNNFFLFFSFFFMAAGHSCRILCLLLIFIAEVEESPGLQRFMMFSIIFSR